MSTRVVEPVPRAVSEEYLVGQNFADKNFGGQKFMALPRNFGSLVDRKFFMKLQRQESKVVLVSPGYFRNIRILGKLIWMYRISIQVALKRKHSFEIINSMYVVAYETDSFFSALATDNFR